MSFRLVPNSVTLDDLERRNSPNCSVTSPNLVAFKWLKIHQYFLPRKCRPKNLVLEICHLPPVRALKCGTSLSLAKIWPIISQTWKRCKIGGKIVLGSRIWAFDWYQNRWPWMTLNGVMAVTLRYFTEFGKHAFQHITASICDGIYARVYCTILLVFCST